MNELGVGTIPPILCRPQAKGLARVVSISRVRSKQQDILNNKSISIYGELQKRSKNGGRYIKKRKGRKSNRICRKNEESTRGGESSTEKNTGKNEEVYRQKQKRNGELEERKLSNAEHQRLSIQRKTSTETGRKICGAIQNKRSGVDKCGEIAITEFNENSPGS